MKTKKETKKLLLGLLVVAGLVAATKVYGKVSAAKLLTFKFKDAFINSGGISLKTTNIAIRITVSNPTAEPLSFNGFDGDFYIDDYKIANINLGKSPSGGQNVVFPAHGSVTLKIPIKIDNSNFTLSLLNKIVSIATTKSDVPFWERSFGAVALKGNLKALDISFPLDLTQELKLPKEAANYIKQIKDILGKK